MSEQILQDGETVILKESCDYCGDGAFAIVKSADVILTNKRFIILKNKVMNQVLYIIPILIAVGVTVGSMPSRKYGYMERALIGAIVGGIIGGLTMMITRFLSKNKPSDEIKPNEIIASIDRGNIESVEDGYRGVRKMLVVKFKDGALYKLSVKDKEGWRSALLKK